MTILSFSYYELYYLFVIIKKIYKIDSYKIEIIYIYLKKEMITILRKQILIIFCCFYLFSKF